MVKFFFWKMTKNRKFSKFFKKVEKPQIFKKNSKNQNFSKFFKKVKKSKFSKKLKKSKILKFFQKSRKTTNFPKNSKNPSVTDSGMVLINQPTRVSEIWVFLVFWDSTRFLMFFHESDLFYCGFQWFLTKNNEFLK